MQCYLFLSYTKLVIFICNSITVFLFLMLVDVPIGTEAVRCDCKVHPCNVKYKATKAVS